MIIMKNFTSENIDIGGGIIISIAKDDAGADWYESQNKFKDDSLKIVFDSNGVILSMGYDVSALNVEGASVAEIEPADIPPNVDIGGGWVFDGKKVIERVYNSAELIAQATTKRDSLMAAAAVVIAPLQDAVDIGDATESELASLREWKKYRVSLSRLDLLAAPDIDWPEVPQS